MEELKNLEEERRAAGGMPGHLPAMPKGVASDEMCVFLILNISSLQLIPMNVVAYRSQYGTVKRQDNETKYRIKCEIKRSCQKRTAPLLEKSYTFFNQFSQFFWR